MKRQIRLTESDLHNIIKESVKRIINEKAEYVQGNLFGDDSEYSEPLGNLEKREAKKRKQKEANKRSREKSKEKKYEKEKNAKNEFTRKYSMFKESTLRRPLQEDFEQDYNNARNNYDRQMWGMEMKNPEGDWEYGDVTYDPQSQTMSCMNATIEVDPDFSVDENLQALYDELVNQGYSDGDDEY